MAVSVDTGVDFLMDADAVFQTWVGLIHDALEAVGMVQTADTGQLNPATVTFPGTNFVDAGYEVWRFDDAEQASFPIFVKVIYGRNGGTDEPRVKLVVGGATDGAGSISDVIWDKNDNNFTNSETADDSGIIHIAHSDGALVMAFQATSSGAGFGLSVERLRDPSDGSVRDDAAGVFGYGELSYGVSRARDANGQHQEFDGGTLPYRTPVVYPTGDGSTSAQQGSDIGFGMCLFTTHRVEPQSIGFVPYIAADINLGTEGAITLHGTERDYITRHAGDLGAFAVLGE